MPNRLPKHIDRQYLLSAIEDLDRRADHPFADSTRYDVLFEGNRYPPKAVVGIAATKQTGQLFGPYDFTGGLDSACFRVLKAHDFQIVPKADFEFMPEEVDELLPHLEGAVAQVTVNRYERDPSARKSCLAHYGYQCFVCGFNFEVVYGSIGKDFIHVHHLVPLSTIKTAYSVDPINDLRPGGPNCHAMLHRANPPLTPEQLRQQLLHRS